MPGKLNDVATREYLECIAELPIARITADSELLVVIEHVREVLTRHKRSERPDGVRAYVETQQALIDIYVKQRQLIFAIEDHTDAEILRFIIATGSKFDEAQMTIDSLATHTGAPAAFYLDVLNGKAELTREDIADMSDLTVVQPTMFDFSPSAGLKPGRWRLRDSPSEGYEIVDTTTNLAIPVPGPCEELHHEYDDHTYSITPGQRSYEREFNRRLRDDAEFQQIVIAAFELSTGT